MALLTLLLMFVVLASGQGMDLTLTENAAGQEVVEAVVDRIRAQCLFTDDRFLLRRLAFVESQDGEAADTYRVGYDGGIWKVDYAMFAKTSACAHPLRNPCAHIKSAFGIDWTRVSWSDLRKPLYSGLGAVLFILSLNRPSLPADTVSQAQFWSTDYRRGAYMNSYILAAQQIRDTGCSSELDLAFVLDGSGSIHPDEFERVKGFVINVVRDFNISKQGVQVAVVEFSSHVGNVIHLNSYSEKTSLNYAIGRVQKSGHTTNTAAAIDVVTSSIFTANEGARINAKRVTILLTDGASGNRPATVAAAQKAKDKGVIMFTVGVGSVNDEELNNVASQPSCTHYYKLNNFGEIDHLVYEIKKRSCRAPKVISATSDDDTPSSVTTPLGTDTVTNTFVLHPNNSTSASGTDKVIKTDVECGILKIYASYDTPNPGPAFYNVKAQVVDGRPSIMKVNTTREGRPLYVTVIGTKLQESCSDVLKCRDAKFSLSVVDAPVTSVVKVVCRTWEGERPCTEADLVNNGFQTPSCPTTTSTLPPKAARISNPCNSDVIAARFRIKPHPFDVSKFIVCDVRGNMYITDCPNQGSFNPSSLTCNNAAIFSLAEPISFNDSIFDYICNDMLVPSKMHFPHPTDQTKYIQCDLHSISHVRSCGQGTVYNDDIQNCAKVGSNAVKVKVVDNPCKTARVGSLHAHSDPKKFIQCTSSSYAIMSCGVGTQWDDVIKACGW
ncbi:uncharacterized protein [Haliotis cracherodii]|uniref:uncharacterized protein n=1 Tax=Haliotis cracherodii TaxID=6455 RepID=UPI0039E84334